MVLADATQVESNKMVRTLLKTSAGIMQDVEFYVVGKLPCALLLSMPWLCKYNPSIDQSSFQLTFEEGYKLRGVPSSTSATRPSVTIISAKVM